MKRVSIESTINCVACPNRVLIACPSRRSYGAIEGTVVLGLRNP